jgi:type IV secretory pathway VirB4 component
VARTAIEQAYVMTQDTGRQPILSDVQELLREYEGPEEEYNSYARTLYLQLKAWLSDQRHQRLFNRSKEFSLTGEFQVFDFFGLKEDPALGGILLLVCSHLVWNQLKRLERSSNKMVVFDEAWALIQNEAGAELIQSLYRTARKFNGCILAISQSASDVLNTPVRDAIVNNTATFFLQKHNHGFTEAAEVCQLTERKRLMLRELEYKQGEFADCLVVDKVNSNAQIVRLVPTSFDLWLNTTNPTDVAFRDHIQHSQRLSFLDAIKVLSEQHPKGAPKGFQKEMS